MASHGVPRASVVVDRSEAAKAKERKQIDEYLELEKAVRERITAKDLSNDTFQLTTRLLKQNPEYYTIWNNRRQILQDVMSQQLAAKEDNDLITDADKVEAEKAGMSVEQRGVFLVIKEDLQFLVPLLRQFPKCYWIWNHRAWLLNEATVHLPVNIAIELWKGELGLVTKMLGLDSRNFHGWDYRRKTVSELERLSESSMVASEFEYTTKMIKSNLSNFSAWHNRSQLIPRLLQEQKADETARTKLLDTEFELITTALYTDPYDQSLWFYHQYLMSTLDPAAPTNASEYGRSTAILENVSDAQRIHYLEQELDSIRDMLDGAEDCKYIYQALLEYAARYRAGSTADRIRPEEMRGWLEELEKQDPLRKGRWSDLRQKLSLLSTVDAGLGVQSAIEITKFRVQASDFNIEQFLGKPSETHAYHASMDENIYDEIEIEDMVFDEAQQLYHYPCPCGDRFQISIDDLRDGEEIAVCPSCSLMIRVIYEVDALPKAG